MSDYWREKVVVVTGGSSGLGLAFAHSLVAQGAKVVMVARNESKLRAAADALAQPDRVLGLPGDITNPEDLRELPQCVREEFGRVDALINCAGKSCRGEVLSTPLSDFQDLWELNSLALIGCTQVFAEDLTATQGHVINIGSLASKFGSRFLGAYPTSKFPLAAFSQQLRLEAKDRFHVLLVCPGPISRSDAGERYAAADVPAAARQPGGGAKIKGLSPTYVVSETLKAAEQRKAELVLPKRARLLMVVSAVNPGWGDWLLKKFSS